MLEVQDQEYYEKVEDAAKKAGCLKALKDTISYLHNFGGNEDCYTTKLYKDFAPWSFYFMMFRADKDGTLKFFMNGGMIYSGPGLEDEGSIRLDGGAPSFTVSLEPTGDEHRWSIHT